MRHGKATLLAAFLLAVGAGVVVGVAAARQKPAAPAPPGERSWLADELNLNPPQRVQMKAIWSEVAQGPIRSATDRRRALSKERDEAIQHLLGPDQRPQYDKILADFSAKVADLGRDREKQMAAAVERTKQILTDAQRQKYDELLKERGGRLRHGAMQGRPDTRPATRPAAPG